MAKRFCRCASLLFTLSLVTLECLGAEPEPAVDVRVKQLIKTLIKDPEKPTPDLVRIGEPAVNALVELLESGDPRVRLPAMEILGYIGPKAKSAVPSLIPLLQDSSELHARNVVWQTRWKAAETLGKMGPAASAALHALLDLLRKKDQDNAIHSMAAWAVARIGGTGVLLEIVQDTDVWGKEATIGALGGLGKEARSAVPTLAEILRNTNALEHQRYLAAVALGQIAEEGQVAIPALQAFIRETSVNCSVRICAARSLCAFGAQAKESVPLLISLLEEARTHGDPGELAVALGQIAPHAKAAVAPLIRVLREARPGSLTVERVAVVLGAFGPDAAPAIPVLLEVLKSTEVPEHPNDRGHSREAAAEALGRIHAQPATVVSALAEVLGDPEVRLRIRALEALAAFGADARAALPELVQALKESPEGRATVAVERPVRLRAMEVLGMLGKEAKTALPELVPFLSARDPDLCMKASEALVKVASSGELILRLEHILKSDHAADNGYLGVLNAIRLMNPRTEAAVPLLATVLGKGVGGAKELLAPFGTAAAPKVILVATDRQADPQGRWNAMNLLETWGVVKAGALPALVRILKDDTVLVGPG